MSPLDSSTSDEGAAHKTQNFHSRSHLPPPPRGDPPPKLGALLPPPKGDPPGGALQTWHDAFSQSGKKHSNEELLHRADGVRTPTGKVHHDHITAQPPKPRSYATSRPEIADHSRGTRLSSQARGSRAQGKAEPSIPSVPVVALAVPVVQIGGKAPGVRAREVPVHAHERVDVLTDRNTKATKPADYIQKLAAAIQEAKTRKADRALARQQVR